MLMNHYQKPRVSGLPTTEDGIILGLRTFVLMQYQRVTNGQTDKQTNRNVAANCIAARCNNSFDW